MENKRQLPSYSFFQASEDAKKLVSQERSFACAEIESARAVVQRIGEALDEQERDNLTSGKKQVRGRHLIDLISILFYFQNLCGQKSVSLSSEYSGSNELLFYAVRKLKN